MFFDLFLQYFKFYIIEVFHILNWVYSSIVFLSYYKSDIFDVDFCLLIFSLLEVLIRPRSLMSIELFRYIVM